MRRKLPNGNFEDVPIVSAEELGLLIRAARKERGLTQKDISGLGNTGNRVIVDMENGKPTVQLKKVLDLVWRPS